MPGSAVFDARDTQTVRVLRGMLLAVFFLGTLGTGIELMLLGHYAELPQLIPGGMILLALAFLAAWILIRVRVVLRVFQVFMFLFVASGTLGIYLHYQSNVEFELEMNPSATGRELIWESLTGAMPVLAPGTMVQLGVVGLLYTCRHPIFWGLYLRVAKPVTQTGRGYDSKTDDDESSPRLGLGENGR